MTLKVPQGFLKICEEVYILQGDVPRHVNWNSIDFGSSHSMSCVEANEIIEEIMSVLISRKLTVKVAKTLLSETISSIDKEFVLDKRKIGTEII